MHRALTTAGLAICALVTTALLAAQTHPPFPRADLEALLPALSDRMRPLARTLLDARSGSDEQVKAAGALYEFASHEFEGDSAAAKRFFQLLAVSDAAPSVRTSALYGISALSRTADGCPRDTAAVHRFRTLATTDTSSLVRGVAVGALSGFFACDSLSLATYRQVMASDPSPEVRRQTLQPLASMGLAPPAWRLPGATVKELLLSRIAADGDSVVVATAIAAYHEFIRDTALPAALAARIAQHGEERALRWLAAAQQQLRDARRHTIPWFMREAPPVFAAVPARTSRVRLFALGDWGDSNTVAQQQVSAAVRAAHRRTPFHFGLALGDNFYEQGLNSPRNPRWQLEYEQQYGALGIPVYAVLGNHEYSSQTAPAAEIAYTGYSKTWKMPATHYTFTAGPAQFFMLDTQHLAAWQLGWLDSALAASTAPWKIVVGHYELYSNRRADSSSALIRLLKRHQVPVYLNGHYHTLQHYQVDGIDYVTSGAGGRSLYDIDTAKVEPTRKFAAKSHGFAVVDVTPTRFVLRFRDTTGKELYRYERRR